MSCLIINPKRFFFAKFLGCVFFLNSIVNAQELKFKLNFLSAFWSISPGNDSIKGEVNYYFICLKPGNRLTLNCASTLIIDSVKGSGLSYIQSDNLVTIQFSNIFNINQTDSFKIYYHGAPNATGFGSFKNDTHNGVPVFWTLSQPYGAKDWWPSPGALDYKIDSLSITLETPPGFRGVANGLLQKEEIVGNKKRYYFKHNYPIATYLIAIASSNYAVRVDSVDLESKKLPVITYAYPEDSVTVCSAVNENNYTLKIFNQKLGQYPFINEQYGHAQINFGGGMEHQTISFEGYFGEDLLAHELAHQWFGNKITCQSWRDIWLNEAFATYCEGLNREWKNQKQEFFIRRKNWNKLVINEPNGSVYLTGDTSDFKKIFDYRLRYAKGAMVLHMLRRWVGDDAFFAALQNYLNDSALSYSSAKTLNLLEHFEDVFGGALDYFFDSWIYGEGYPSYSIYWSQETNKIKLRINQQASSGSNQVFPNRLSLGFITDTKDTILKDFLIKQVLLDTIIEVAVGVTVTDVLIDPLVESISGFNRVNPPVFHFKDNLLHAYPNPATDNWIIEYQNTANPIQEISFYYPDGSLIYTLSNYEYFFGPYNVINLQSFKPGTYLAEIKTSQSVFCTHLIIK